MTCRRHLFKGTDELQGQQDRRAPAPGEKGSSPGEADGLPCPPETSADLQAAAPRGRGAEQRAAAGQSAGRSRGAPGAQGCQDILGSGSRFREEKGPGT